MQAEVEQHAGGGGTCMAEVEHACRRRSLFKLFKQSSPQHHAGGGGTCMQGEVEDEEKGEA